MAHAVTMIAALCVKLGISEHVDVTLLQTTVTHNTKTKTKIVVLLRAGLGELPLNQLKHCRNESSICHSWEDYKGIWFYNSQQALLVERWLNQVEEDASDLTFEEWDPTQDADASQPPVAMPIYSLELRAAGFTLREEIPPALVEGHAYILGGSSPTSGYGS